VADEVGADLIIMGSHGRTGFKKLVLGSVAQAVLTQSPIPVLIIKV
jgi:nucleotide-binding universal stress UspA family protein